MSSHAREHPPGDLTGTRPAGPPARPAEGAVRRRLATLGTLLLTFTALPAALLVVPDASGGVVPAAASALALGDAEIPGLLRATGLSLPALLVTVPLAAVAARRLPAWGVLMAGFAVLLAGIGAARLADSLPDIGTVRALQGAGAGIVLPASLVLVWERRNPALSAAWAGALAGTLILAMPLALKAVPVPADGAAVPDWRVALAPYPLLAVAAAGAALAHPLLRGRRHRRPPPLRRTERGPLLLVPVPAGGFAFLAVVAAHGWSPGARLLLAGLTLLALAGLAFAGARAAAAGGPSGGAVVMIAVGLLCQPVAGPLAGLAAAGTGTAGPPALPFAVAAAAALAAALAATRTGTRGAVRTGYLLMAAAVPLGLAGGALGRWALLAPLVPLGAGAGLALAASLRDARVGAALFGLSLCFPAVLAGQLLVLSLQAARLQRSRPVTDAQHVHALLEGYRIWLAVAGVVAVLLAGATARLCAGRAATTRARAPRLSGNATAGPGAG
ncbi:multisubunit Na+/H+ antiporter MnhG subunit [Actinomadura luteofluorescens]|uniref:Multisubunit Na+/H+ antiporter MnhG subunit n=1 Tax=Actinomadura luteofluorescens TaxID=46163 RepID=A0A7Y9JJ59_9ACTN|nr:hypothetical protein [Actinomadura luteofluorescens]NYD50526.1 multisubunit Na+/H+ antiporter MnhG subunit [Actinomadura luteofluorescens]